MYHLAQGIINIKSYNNNRNTNNRKRKKINI